MARRPFPFIGVLLPLFLGCATVQEIDDRIQPYVENPFYFEISQNNANNDQGHYDQIQAIRSRVTRRPVPLNNVKIYGGAVTLNLGDAAGQWSLRWLEIRTSGWSEGRAVVGGAALGLKAPADGPWAALILPAS